MDEQLFSSGDIEFLSKLLKEATKEELETNISINWHQLLLSAQNFIKGYTILTKNEELQRKQMRQSLIQQDPTSSTNFLYSFQQKHKDAYFTRAKYLLAFQFDAQLTAYLGEVPKKAVYVIWDSKKKQLRSFEMSMATLASLASAEGRLNLHPGQLKEEGATEIEKGKNAIGGFQEEHLIETQAAYRGTVARLGQYYNKIGVNWTQRKNGLLMWKESGAWIVANVNSYGDAKEGYIAALMTKHKSNLDALFNQGIGNERFYADTLISAFYNNYISGVTNKAAIVEEDVVTENGQFAVKSSGASMPSLTQYLKAAQEIILNSENGLSPENLKKRIEELYPQDIARNKIIATLQSDAELTTTDLLSELQKKGLSLTYNI